MEAALCGCNCPRCGIIVASRTDKALPSGRTFTFYTCPRCHQILATAAEDKYDADRSLDYAKPFVYGRSLVYLPGDWRRLPVIQPITDEILAKIRSTFVPRENDIWLTTYPKCGTTWIQNVLSHLVYSNSNTGPVQVGLQVTDDVIWMDALCGIHGVEPIMAHVNTMPTDRPRMFKSHAPIGLLEPTVSSGAKVVHVARNCKDVAVSMWHHSVAKNEPYEGDFEHFFEQLFLTGESESGLYFDFVLPYCKATDRWSENVKSDAPKPFSQITTIWYETMTKEPLETVAALAAFLGIDASIERLRSICETCCFESMKELESKYGTRLSSRILEHDSSSGDKETASMSHIRKGGVGGWRSYLSEDQSARLDALSAEKCREHGATLPSIS